jgi:hypothetical protein
LDAKHKIEQWRPETFLILCINRILYRYDEFHLIHLKNKMYERIRLAAFEWLAKQIEVFGDVLPRDLLV